MLEPRWRPVQVVSLPFPAGPGGVAVGPASPPRRNAPSPTKRSSYRPRGRRRLIARRRDLLLFLSALASSPYTSFAVRTDSSLIPKLRSDTNSQLITIDFKHFTTARSLKASRKFAFSIFYLKQNHTWGGKQFSAGSFRQFSRRFGRTHRKYWSGGRGAMARLW